MIYRRDVMTAAIAVPFTLAAGAANAALPVPPGGRIGFRMLRNGDVIGSHTLTFTSQGDTLAVAVEIDILVKFVGIPVYRYSHRATERWAGGQFAGIESRTDRDGSPRQMRAIRAPEGVVVEGTKAGRYIAPPVALPTTYWNRAMLNPQLINSEDGQLMGVTVVPGAMEQVPLASGGTIAARHYRMGGELQLEIWYDAAGQWAHLEFTKDGSTIIYEKL
jgi:hypothetical protein